MRFLYWVYVNVFWCLRTVSKAFYEEQRVKPIETREATWLYVDANVNGDTHDVTERVRDYVRSDTILTPQLLESITRMEGVQSWGYLTKSLEYNKIPAEGVVNGL